MKSPNKKKSKGHGVPKNGESLPDRFVPAFWTDADSRFLLVRQVRARVEALKEDVGCDSKQKEILVERCAFLAIRLESQEVQAIKGDPFDCGSYVQSVNALVGLLRTLGLEKHAKSAESLEDYMARKGRIKKRKRKEVEV